MNEESRVDFDKLESSYFDSGRQLLFSAYGKENCYFKKIYATCNWLTGEIGFKVTLRRMLERRDVYKDTLKDAIKLYNKLEV